jgi:hypothetical protein
MSTPMTGSEKVTVKSTLAALVGLASVQIMDATLGDVVQLGFID